MMLVATGQVVLNVHCTHHFVRLARVLWQRLCQVPAPHFLPI
jgi:hypothetical protein